MSRDMYFGRSMQGENHGGQMSWGAPSGLPYRGPQLNLKRGEAEQLPIEGDVHIKTFNLNEEADLAEYREVLSRAFNKWYGILFRDHQYNEETGVRTVYVEWVQLYHGPPANQRARMNNGTSGSNYVLGQAI